MTKIALSEKLSNYSPSMFSNKIPLKIHKTSVHVSEGDTI